MVRHVVLCIVDVSIASPPSIPGGCTVFSQKEISTSAAMVNLVLNPSSSLIPPGVDLAVADGAAIFPLLCSWLVSHRIVFKETRALIVNRVRLLFGVSFPRAKTRLVRDTEWRR